MVVVTQHKSLVDFLIEKGVITKDAVVIPHVNSLDVIRDKDVVGVLPIYMAAVCKSITVVPLMLPKELRGKELSLEEVRQYAGVPTKYVVTKEEE